MHAEMGEQSQLERRLADLLVESLEIDDVDPATIDPEGPLFGRQADSLGLDSIDALEIALALNQEYGVELRADDEQNRQVFTSLRSLAEYVERARGESV